VVDDRVDRLAAVGVRLTGEQLDALTTFQALLAAPGAERGVISRGDLERVFERHILDSLRALAAVRDEDHRAYDLGAGGGLPGIPVAIAAPRLSVALVEARPNRAAFLSLVAERLGLPNLRVAPERIERLTEAVDVCFARAIARAPRCWELARPLLRPGGRLAYFAGARFDPGDLAGLPGDPRIELRDPPAVATGGPLVIMSRP
jgi:16S rRNA (guanine527-N7)-methyltransferase